MNKELNQVAIRYFRNYWMTKEQKELFDFAADSIEKLEKLENYEHTEQEDIPTITIPVEDYLKLLDQHQQCADCNKKRWMRSEEHTIMP